MPELCENSQHLLCHTKYEIESAEVNTEIVKDKLFSTHLLKTIQNGQIFKLVLLHTNILLCTFPHMSVTLLNDLLHDISVRSLSLHMTCLGFSLPVDDFSAKYWP